MIATGFQRRTEASAGRESQSIAFLSDARGAAVVLGRRDQERVRLGDGRSQLRDRLGVARRLDVVVVERDRRQVEDLDLDVRRRELGGSPQERRVVRALPQAAGDAEDSGHWRIAVMSAVISTRVGPHSISPSTRKSVFSTPSASVPVPWNFASSSTGIATSLIVSSPAILWRSPSTCSMRLDSNRISGNRSVSSRSFERRWRVALLVVGEDARACARRRLPPAPRRPRRYPRSP